MLDIVLSMLHYVCVSNDNCLSVSVTESSTVPSVPTNSVALAGGIIGGVIAVLLLVALILIAVVIALIYRTRKQASGDRVSGM